MRKITIAALLLMALAGTAYAQQGKDDPYAAKHAQQAREAAQLDKEYRTVLKLTDKPTQTRVDPWANMRSSSTGQSKP
jgi:hypothetical protein